MAQHVGGDRRPETGDRRPETGDRAAPALDQVTRADHSLERASDVHVCALIAERNPYAARELLRRYAASVVLPEALRVVANLADAEDVESELLVKLLAGPVGLGWEWPPSSVREWLTTVTLRLALDLKRSRDSERRRRVKQSEWLPASRLPDDLAFSNELSSNLVAAVQDLPTDEREAVTCLFSTDLPAEEACVVLGVSRRTLYRHRRKALARLRESVHLKGYAAP